MRFRCVVALAVLIVFAAPIARPQQTASQDTALRRDATGFVLPGEWLRRLPIDDLRAALFLVPGVVSREFGPGVIARGDASLRGGAPGRASVYIDGAPARVMLLGDDGTVPAIAAIDALRVTTGVPEIWLGDAGGGVLSYETRGGGERLAGDARIESDEFFGDGTSVGYNRFEGWLSGPLPGLPGMTWSVSGTALGQRSRYRGPGAVEHALFVTGGIDTIVTGTDPATGSVTHVLLPQYVQAAGTCGSLGGAGALGADIRGNYGYDCTGLRLPMDWSTDLRGHAKLAYHYGDGGRVTLTGLAADQQGRGYPGRLIGAPGLYRFGRFWSRLVVANWAHPLRLLGAPATLAANLSWATDRVIEGSPTPASDIATRAPALGIELESIAFMGGEVFPFPIDDRIIRNVRTNSGLRVPYLGRSDLQGSQPYRLNPYGMLAGGWYTSGVDGPLTLLSERRLQGRWSLEWRANDRHELLLGAEAGGTEASFYTTPSLVQQGGLDGFRVDPARLGVFAGDRIRVGVLTADVGLRYDRFGGGGLLPVTPGRIFTHPRWSVEAATNDSVYAAMLADTAIWRPVAAHAVWSPRVSATLGFSGATVARFGVGRQVEAPSLELVYGRSNADLATTSLRGEVFGRDVDYASRWLVEAGVRHQLWPALAVDLALYRQTGDQYVGRIQPFVDPADPTDTLQVRALARMDAAAVTGLDLLLDWTIARSLAAMVTYAWRHEHTYGIHQVSGLAQWRGPEVPAAGLLGAITGGWRATVLFRLTSGLPYTRLSNVGSGVTFRGSQLDVLDLLFGGAAESFNASRLPWSRQLDFRLDKGWRFGKLDGSAFVDVRNPLNLQSQVDLFLETGGVENPRHRVETLGDPVAGSREYAQLWDEATHAGAFDPATRAVTFRNCQSWDTPVNCESLRRVEVRFGDGDGVLTNDEFQRSLNAYYDAFYGSWRFYQPGRTARLGLQLSF